MEEIKSAKVQSFSLLLSEGEHAGLRALAESAATSMAEQARRGIREHLKNAEAGRAIQLELNLSGAQARALSMLLDRIAAKLQSGELSAGEDEATAARAIEVLQALDKALVEQGIEPW